MASTITRFAWTDDSGTPASPVGDGTIINNAQLQAIFDAIDALFTLTTFTFGGKIVSTAFGDHVFSASGTGQQSIQVRNTAAGTGNSARVLVGNDTSSALLSLIALSSTFTGGNNLALVDAAGAGGLIVRTSHASGTLTLGSGSAQTFMSTTASGNTVIGGGSLDDNFKVKIGGTVTASGGTGAGLRIETTVNGAVNQNMFGAVLAPTLVEAGSGTHAIAASLILNPPTITAGAAAITNAATLYVNGAPSAGATNNALYVSGASVLGGNVAVTATSSANGLFVSAGSLGGGAAQGPVLGVGYNTDGAPGTIRYTDRSGNNRPTWVDSSGNVRISTTGVSPTADNTTVADTSGTVVGTQTSTRATKRMIRRYVDVDAALRLIERTPLYRFKYRAMDRETQFVGVMADESPAFVMHAGQSFNPVNAFGYTAGAVQALARRLHRLEQLAGV